MAKMWLGTYYRCSLLKKLGFRLEGKNALEIGCHDGFLLHNISAQKKTGIDLEPMPKYPDIKYIKGDFLEYDFKGKKFDRIIAIEVMEHVPSPDIFLQNINKILSKDGCALLS